MVVAKIMVAADLKELTRIFELELMKSLDRPMAEGEFLSARLSESIRYALSSPGKRLRPLLVLTTALAHKSVESTYITIKLAMPAALAVEYVHTYSLIHDDLPAMDDDDFRRGQPSLHRRFDEGLAILAGDALLADAFYQLSSAKHNAARLVRELALTAGSRALVAGQSEDLNSNNCQANMAYWLKINAAKTGRLFEACASLGALSVDATVQQVALSRAFGRAFGDAFQIKDDLDDDAGLAMVADVSELNARFKENLDRAYRASRDFLNNQALVELLHLTFAT